MTRKQKTAKQMSLELGSYMREEEKMPAVSADIKKIASSFKKQNEKKEFRIFVAGGSRSGNDPIYEKEAYQLGRKIAQMNFRLDFGLSGSGIMGAVAKGVLSVWVKQNELDQIPIKGITTKEYLALTRKNEVVDKIKEVIVAHTLEERKNQLLNADFVIFAPGGIGTLDELVYDCVAMQDGFLRLKPFIIFNVNGHYHHVLEYLKEIAIKGFSAPMPFIVVDDSFEAGVVFEILKTVYQANRDRSTIREAVERLIYYLPYILQCKLENPSKPVGQIIDWLREKKDDPLIKAEVEKAYLRKEIDRMYDRLERTGKDTAQVSEKLSGLKERRKKEIIDGLY